MVAVVSAHLDCDSLLATLMPVRRLCQPDNGDMLPQKALEKLEQKSGAPCTSDHSEHNPGAGGFLKNAD